MGGTDGKRGVARGQDVCREERVCRVELLKGAIAGSSLTQVFPRVRFTKFSTFFSQSKKDR